MNTNTVNEGCASRLEEWRKRNEEEKEKRSGFSSEGQNIWFSWGEKKEHTVRLVGDFIVTKSHWIGPSKWNASINLFNEKSFEGEEKLPVQMNCNNWDIDTEHENKSGGCIVCKLRKIANDILYSPEGKNLSEKEKEYFKDLRYKCDAKTRYFFNCLDRDNPYVDEANSVLGYKVIEIPWELMDGIIAISSKMKGIDISGPENGIDLLISRTGGGKDKKEKVKYSVQPVYDGLSAKVTPLTEIEKALIPHDLKLLKGKKIENGLLKDKLNDEFKAFFEGNSEVNSGDGNAPF